VLRIRIHLIWIRIQHFKLNTDPDPASTSKHEMSQFFLPLWLIFALLDPDPDSEYGSGFQIRIRIHWPD
jgi:hypothetical protein